MFVKFNKNIFLNYTKFLFILIKYRVCKHEWCWLCRRKYKRGHFSRENILGCPGFYANKTNWPMNKIYKYRLKIFMIWILRVLFFLIFGLIIMLLWASWIIP